MNSDLDQPGLCGTRDHAMLERTFEELRENGEQVKRHSIRSECVESFRHIHFNAAQRGIDGDADAFRKRNQ